jgi:rhomboid protease GluP
VQLSVLIDYGAAEGVLIQQGEVYRLITASFLHVDLMHIIMNSISLLFLCTRFEKIYRVYTPFVLLASSITGMLWIIKDLRLVCCAVPIM